MKVWIVEGATGEYEDSFNWIAKAFVSEERAKAFQAKLDDILKENQLHYENIAGNQDVPDELSKLDPNVDVDYTGSRYVVYSIEVEE